MEPTANHRRRPRGANNDDDARRERETASEFWSRLLVGHPTHQPQSVCNERARPIPQPRQAHTPTTKRSQRTLHGQDTHSGALEFDDGDDNTTKTKHDDEIESQTTSSLKPKKTRHPFRASSRPTTTTGPPVLLDDGNGLFYEGGRYRITHSIGSKQSEPATLSKSPSFCTSRATSRCAPVTRLTQRTCQRRSSSRQRWR